MGNSTLGDQKGIIWERASGADSRVINRRMRIGHKCPVYRAKTDFDEGCKDSVSAGVEEVSAVSYVGFKVSVVREACAIFLCCHLVWLKSL